MSIYHKEEPAYFDKAMQSIWDEQTEKPSEIILVLDGPLNRELYRAINKWKGVLDDVLKITRLDKNSGLAIALNTGLKKCQYEYIARMDTDDISNEKRFESQLSFLEKNPNIDIVGTYVSEIDENGEEIKPLVKFPLTHNLLYRFFSKRDPVAHPSVMFRRSFFDKSGPYPVDVLLAEDTLLWYKGFLNNCNFANIPYIGLKFRRSSNFYDRRADKKKSINLLQYRINTINKELGYNYLANIYAIAYFLISISPKYVKKIMYELFR